MTTDQQQTAETPTGAASALDDGLDAFSVKAPTTADFFILMVRYGDDYWSAHTTHRCIDDARKTAFGCSEANGQTAWRIVRVDGLPVNVPSGEV